MNVRGLFPRLKTKKAAEGEKLCEECKGKSWIETDFGFLQCANCQGQGIIEENVQVHKTLRGPPRI